MNVEIKSDWMFKYDDGSAIRYDVVIDGETKGELVIGGAMGTHCTWYDVSIKINDVRVYDANVDVDEHYSWIDSQTFNNDLGLLSDEVLEFCVSHRLSEDLKRAEDLMYGED